jgi:hypothetical protein
MTYSTVREEPYAGVTLRLLKSKTGEHRGIILKKGGGLLGPFGGDGPDEIWERLKQEVLKAGRAYVGFDGARARFLRFFPQGFADSGYLREERDYKLAAKAQLDAAAPVEEAAQGRGFGLAVLAAFQHTNLLSPFEKMKLPPLLRGPSADGFVRAAASFAQGEGLPALQEMRKLAQPHDCAKWAVLTYLPFMWRPDIHMFLKPTVTQEFAARVGHPFAHTYAPDLDIAIYDSLLDLVARTEDELAALGPRDRIDVQSFIWVVGAYNEEELPAAPR